MVETNAVLLLVLQIRVYKRVRTELCLETNKVTVFSVFLMCSKSHPNFFQVSEVTRIFVFFFKENAKEKKLLH